MGKGADLAFGAVDSAIGAGMGLLLGDINDKRQLKQQERLGEQNWKFQKRAAEFNMQQQLEMWKATNYSAQMEEMRKAGLNPALAYGMKGGGGVTTGSSNASAPQSGVAPVGGGEAMGMMQQRIQMRLLAAQEENIRANTEKTRVEAAKTSGVDTELATVGVENAKLDGVIKKVTGLDMKNKWEQVTFPNRGIEAELHQSEMEARQGIAKVTYDLWVEGKLRDKSNYEIEQLMLNNSKTREETKNIIKTFDLLEEQLKGMKLSNIITKLEADLQTETGLDKNSPGLLKIIGRLFMGIGGWKTLDAIK